MHKEHKDVSYSIRVYKVIVAQLKQLTVDRTFLV